MFKKIMLAVLLSTSVNNFALAQQTLTKVTIKSTYGSTADGLIYHARKGAFNKPKNWQGEVATRQFKVDKDFLLLKTKASANAPQISMKGLLLPGKEQVIRGAWSYYSYDLRSFKNFESQLKISGDADCINAIDAIKQSTISAKKLFLPSSKKPTKKSTPAVIVKKDTRPVVVNLLAMRPTAEKSGATATRGASAAGQDALKKSLDWLAQVQNPNGSWGEMVFQKNGFSGLALLTYLAHGETPQSKKYGETVQKAIKHLCSQTKFEGSHSGSYSQAIKIQALAEAYTMTGNDQIIAPLTTMVIDLLDCQSDSGGFDYFRKGQRTVGVFNNSLSSWAFQAIKAAQETGLKFGTYGKLVDVEKKCITHMKVAAAEGWPYSMGKSSKLTTNMGLKGVGVFNLLLFTQDKNLSGVKKLLKDLSRNAHKQLAWNAAQGNKIYGWYHITNAFFQEEGNNWKKWNKKIEKILVDNQHPAGYWDYPGVYFGKTIRGIDDKLHATVLCSLILTTNYRYLSPRQVKRAKARLKLR